MYLFPSVTVKRTIFKLAQLCDRVLFSDNICGYYYLAKHKELSANVVWAKVWLSTWNGVAAAAILLRTHNHGT